MGSTKEQWNNSEQWNRLSEQNKHGNETNRQTRNKSRLRLKRAQIGSGNKTKQT
jgi:hypothetical protein